MTENKPEPGIYKDIPFDEYTMWRGASATTLKTFSRTPAHARYAMLHGGKPRTAALDLGWFVHLAVLEAAKFEAEIVVPPKVDKRTKVGKATWAQFEAEHAGKILVDADMHDKVKAMAASVLEHETAREFFVANPGHNELSIVWDDPPTGRRCKARIDRYGSIGEWPIVGDVKTARDAGRSAMERAVLNFGYDLQAAHYLDGLETLSPIEDGNPFRRFVLFVVESEPPYCCAVYEVDDSALEEGKLKRDRYLRKWKECKESGSYPGYPPGIDYVSLPAWAFKSYQTD